MAGTLANPQIRFDRDHKARPIVLVWVIAFHALIAILLLRYFPHYEGELGDTEPAFVLENVALLAPYDSDFTEVSNTDQMPDSGLTGASGERNEFRDRQQAVSKAERSIIPDQRIRLSTLNVAEDGSAQQVDTNGLAELAGAIGLSSAGRGSGDGQRDGTGFGDQGLGTGCSGPQAKATPRSDARQAFGAAHQWPVTNNCASPGAIILADCIAFRHFSPS